MPPFDFAATKLLLMKSESVLPKAGFVRRAGALALDIAALYVIEFIVSMAGFLIGSTPAAVFNLTQWPVTALYFVAFWTKGRTPGMLAMKLRVETDAGVAPDLFRSALRFLVLGGVTAVASATLLVVVIPYVVVCGFGIYLHDLIAGTVVRRVSSTGAVIVSQSRSDAVAGAISRLVLAFAGLMVAGLVIGFAGGGIGDGAFIAHVRNDSGLDVRLTHAFDGRTSFTDDGPLAPGDATTVEKVGAPRETPNLVIKAYDAEGRLIFCRALTFAEYKDSRSTTPIPIDQGDLRCS